MESAKEKNLLYEVFGNYRAEWLRNRIYEYYTEPKYFSRLLDPRPAVLIGGRGTGKTTVLRAMSYEGQHALGKYDGGSKGKSYGLYYRVNTNRTTAFEGPDLDERMWVRLFAHYFNLLVIKRVLEFTKWHSATFTKDSKFTKDELRMVSMLTVNQGIDNYAELEEALSVSEIELQNFINNTEASEQPFLSLQSAVIDKAFEFLNKKAEFRDSNFFLLIDEYENLLDYQQRILNTLVKHSGDDYTFKIGVKEFGFREKSTLNPNELLSSPADYARIDINDYSSGPEFQEFAISVCSERLKPLCGDILATGDLESLFPSLGIEEEADLLSNGKGKLTESDSRFAKMLQKKDAARAKRLGRLFRYLICFWADKEGKSLEEVWMDYCENEASWKTRYENYKYALLFTLSPKGTSISKYFCGIDTFMQLSGGNIRYFMELIEQSLLKLSRSGGTLGEPVTPKIQTQAAQEVGRKNLAELEGMSVDGAKLSKIVLSIGRIFGIIARDLENRRPEVVQFSFSQSGFDVDDGSERFHQLLRAGISNLAIKRYPGTKATGTSDEKAYDYSLHPIFSAIFPISPRKKRKLFIHETEFLNFALDHQKAIKAVLDRLKIDSDKGREPAQMSFLTPYYNES